MMWMSSYVLRDDPIYRWYEIGNVITVVDAKLESDLSDEADDRSLASEALNADLSHGEARTMKKR